MEADRVVVIDQARVVETGRPAELMERGGAFRQLFGRAGLLPAPSA